MTTHNKESAPLAYCNGALYVCIPDLNDRESRRGNWLWRQERHCILL